MNHPFLNDALAKLDFLKSGGAPNPFVLGRRGFTEVPAQIPRALL